MKLTTPDPPIDLLVVLPELADLRATTVRLHPRKGRVPNRYASKLGGTFLWPADEPWPTCDEPWPPSWTPCVEDGTPSPEGDPRTRPSPLVLVLQLRKEDFPEMPFPPGADLFQLLWCPLDHGYAAMPKPFAFWRRIGEVRRPRRSMPEPDPVAIEMESGHHPEPRRLHPERVVEFPPMELWPKGEKESMYRRLEAACRAAGYVTEHDESRITYEQFLSVCPANKVGGYPFWVLVDLPRLNRGFWANHSEEDWAVATFWDDMDRVRRMVLFGTTHWSDYVGWDPQDVTDPVGHEYGIYRLPHSRREVERLAGSFREFVEEYCLGEGFLRDASDWDVEKSPLRVFRPAWR